MIRYRPSINVALALCAAVSASLVLHTSAFTQTASGLEDRVVVVMSGGPAQDIMQKCTAESFTQKTNVRVEFVSVQAPAAFARVMAQRNNPTLDVLWSIPAVDHTGFKEGVFVPLTRELVPNLANIDPKYSAEPNRGALFSTSIQGIQYNTKIFKEKGWDPPTSWRDLWDPKYKGRVGIYDLGGGSGQALLAVAGFLNGGDSKNMDAAFSEIAKLKPSLYTIFRQAPQFDAAVLEGNVYIGISSAGRILALMLQDNPISFVQPKEGVVVNNLSLQVVKGAPHPKAALAYVNWMLSKEGQSCLPKAGYSTVVNGIDIAPNIAPYMTLQRSVIPFDAGDMQDRLPDLLKRWNKEIDG